MTMERMQILVTTEQRRRLRAAAKAQGLPVTEVVRDAIDAQLDASPSQERRRKALDQLRAMPPVEFVPPEELRELIDSRSDDDMDPPLLCGQR